MRLIDADGLIEAYDRAHKGEPGKARQLILDAPTIEERKSGKWIDNSDGIEGAWNCCSVCGEQAIDLYDFCPNCGADMRGEQE